MTRTLNEHPGVPGSTADERWPDPPGFWSAYPGYQSTAPLAPYHMSAGAFACSPFGGLLASFLLAIPVGDEG